MVCVCVCVCREIEGEVMWQPQRKGTQRRCKCAMWPNTSFRKELRNASRLIQFTPRIHSSNKYTANTMGREGERAIQKSKTARNGLILATSHHYINLGTHKTS